MGCLFFSPGISVGRNMLYISSFNTCYNLYFIKTFSRLSSIISIVLLLFIVNINNTVAQELYQNTIVNKLPFARIHFNDDSGKLQFAIVSDRWGGNRQGIFEDAIDKLELLQPQFVMSVGDLIDGKTYDPVRVEQQWKEFDSIIKPLSMPFFRVPGNHDIGNAMMEKEWEKKLGTPYYFFVYKNALFLIVNTEDGGISGISEKQINYFKKVIAENPKVRWTFIFMHRPVWFNKDNKEEGYEKIESVLKGRNYTLFSGHHHTYLNVVKNGNKHFVLGSTGGGSDLRGEKFGEFDHITWVTLESGEQPKIINLKLNGLIKDDIVNENTYPITNTLINENWLLAPSYVSPNKIEKIISPTIIFNNPTPYPLMVSGSIPDREDYKINPQKIDLAIAPHTRQNQLFTITSSINSSIDLATLPFIEVSLKGAYRLDTVTYELSATKRLLLDWKHELPEESHSSTLADQQFKNADTTGLIAIRNPEYLQNKWYWYGIDDCLLHFKLMRDANYLYLLALIKDDQLVLGNKDQQDLIYVHFEDKKGAPARFTIVPDRVKSTILSDDKTEIDINDVQLKTAILENGMIKLLLRIPTNEIIKSDHSIRFNIGYRDQDNHPAKENSTLFWKPVWGTETDYKSSGTFLLK